MGQLHRTHNRDNDHTIFCSCPIYRALSLSRVPSGLSDASDIFPGYASEQVPQPRQCFFQAIAFFYESAPSSPEGTVRVRIFQDLQRLDRQSIHVEEVSYKTSLPVADDFSNRRYVRGQDDTLAGERIEQGPREDKRDGQIPRDREDKVPDLSGSLSSLSLCIWPISLRRVEGAVWPFGRVRHLSWIR